MKKLGILISFITCFYYVKGQSCDFEILNNQLNTATTYNDTFNILKNYFECLTLKQIDLNESIDVIRETGSKNHEYRIKEEITFHDLHKKKLDHLRKNLRSSPDVLQSINNGIYVIKDKLIQKDLENYIKEIYNPQSKITGKSFTTLLKEQLEEDVINKIDLKDDKLKAIEDVINSISSTPLLSAIPGFEGAISVTNNVIGFVRIILFNNDIKSLKMLEDFEKNISKYLLFYSNLQSANQGFNYNLSEIKARIKILEIDFHEYLINTTTSFHSTIKFKPIVDIADDEMKPNNDKLINLLNRHLDDRRDQLDQDSPYESLLSSEDLIKYNNDLDNIKFFMKEFEEIFELYQNINDRYKDEIKKIVDNNGTFITEDNRDKLKLGLESRTKNSTTSVKNLAGIEVLKSRISEIEFSDIHL